MRIVVLAIGLATFWMVLSGFLKPFLLAMGALSIFASVTMAIRMKTADEEGVPIQIVPGFLTYLPWLLWEIIKSSWTVAQLIIHPKLPISPTMTVVTASQKTAVGVATYANSITLTPGTITTGVTGNALTVHAITSEGARDLEAGDMDRRVTRCEGAA